MNNYPPGPWLRLIYPEKYYSVKAKEGVLDGAVMRVLG